MGSFIATSLPLVPLTQLGSTVSSETRPFLPGRSCGRSRCRSRNRAAGRHGRGGLRPTAPRRLRAHRAPRHRHLRHGVQSVRQGEGPPSAAPCGLSSFRSYEEGGGGRGVAPRCSPLAPRQRDTREVVAVKCVSKRSLNRASVENLLTEIEILKTIRHPHIVELKDFQVGLGAPHRAGVPMGLGAPRRAGASHGAAVSCEAGGIPWGWSFSWGWGHPIGLELPMRLGAPHTAGASHGDGVSYGIGDIPWGWGIP